MEFIKKNLPLFQNDNLNFDHNSLNNYNQELMVHENIRINFQHF